MLLTGCGSLAPSAISAHGSEDLFQEVDDQHVSLSGAFVQSSTGDSFRLEAAMRDGDIAIVVSMPDVDRHRDVF